MHYRMLVSVPKENAETSAEARSYVSSYLEDNGFCAQGGRFSSSPADWFVIGGRWSGELSRLLLGEQVEKDYDQAFRKAANEGDKDPYYTSLEKSDKLRQGQAKVAWGFVSKVHNLDKALKNPFVFGRDQYDHEGCDDDAMLLDEKLYDLTLKEYEGERDRKNAFDEKITYKVKNGEYGEHYSDPDTKWHLAWLDTAQDALSRDLIGKRWIVVVDYHS